MKYFDQEEKELAESIERGEWISVSDEEFKDTSERLAEAAQHTMEKLKKTKNINIRITEEDLQRLKTMAAEEGMPYQTLVSSVLHKYTAGRLVSYPSVFEKAVHEYMAASPKSSKKKK